MNTKQNWTVGNTVKVGFLTLHVCFVCPNGSGTAILRGGVKFYSFVPYNGGLNAVSRDEAAAIVARLKAEHALSAAKATAQSVALADAQAFAATLA